MPNAVIWVFGGILLYLVSRPKIEIIDGSFSETVNSVINDLEYRVLKISNMSSVDKSLVNHPQVKAIFGLIRYGEGTYDAGGYKRLFGGGTFSSYADHPRTVVTKNGYSSSAAGAYQALAKTWDETRAAMNLKDFSPANQDLFALGRIAARGALNDVLIGKLDSAMRKLSREWASLPYSPYGQPTISMTKARSIYALNGGVPTDSAFA